MSSISFDPAATYYDATRGYPPGVEEQIADAIITAAKATQDTHFLEIGVGTGRIAFPIIKRGYHYTGIDVSNNMMSQLRQKIATFQTEQPTVPLHIELLQEDATALSFADNTFDIALSVHVLHLIDRWQDVINEVIRVLKPGGYYLNCGDDTKFERDPWNMQAQWIAIVASLGFTVSNVGHMPSGRNVGVELAKRGISFETLHTATWTVQRTPQELFDGFANRLWSRTWNIPDDIFTASIERLQGAALEHYGNDLSVPEEIEREFVITRIQK